MLLQEVLFNIYRRTSFVKAPSDDVVVSDQTPLVNDGNKKSIIEIAKHFGLTREQIDDLFAQLSTDEHGFYSINDAIPEIHKIKESCLGQSDDSGESEDESNHDITQRNSGLLGSRVQTHSGLLGSRVRTVFENGQEYEGTISTIHYRVKYDDGDTETFSDESDAFENLACNEHYLSCNKFQTCALEIFSGK